jgi:hypothetical protein
VRRLGQIVLLVPFARAIESDWVYCVCVWLSVVSHLIVVRRQDRATVLLFVGQMQGVGVNSRKESQLRSLPIIVCGLFCRGLVSRSLLFLRLLFRGQVNTTHSVDWDVALVFIAGGDCQMVRLVCYVCVDEFP